jgi:hypothetical protein
LLHAVPFLAPHRDLGWFLNSIPIKEMVQEQSSSHHSQLPKFGGSATAVARASKKNKPKKIPQRGLGVAQLEKLRLEEQKKTEGGGVSSVLVPPPAHPRALLPLRNHPPPPVPTMRPGFSPVPWDPAADPMKHQYKRMPPLPTVRTMALLFFRHSA